MEETNEADARDPEVVKAKEDLVFRFSILAHLGSVRPTKGNTVTFTCYHPQCHSPHGIPGPGTYLVSIESRRVASETDAIPLEPAAKYRDLSQKQWIRKKYRGKGKDQKCLWICLPCLEGLLNEQWGFGHPAAGRSKIDPNTTMESFGSRLVGERRDHAMAVSKGNKKLKMTGAYKLDSPNVHAINLWKSIHASKSRKVDSIDPANWKVVKAHDMVTGPGGTRWPTLEAKNAYCEVAGVGPYLSIGDVEHKSLSDILTLVDYRKGCGEGDWEGHADDEGSVDEDAEDSKTVQFSGTNPVKASIDRIMPAGKVTRGTNKKCTHGENNAEHTIRETDSETSWNGFDDNDDYTAQETDEQQEESTEESEEFPSDHSEYAPDGQEDSKDDNMSPEPGVSSDETP